MKLTILLCALLLRGNFAHADPSADSGAAWDLKRAALYALENSPELQSATANREATVSETRNAFYRLLPQLDFHSEHGWQGAGTSAAAVTDPALTTAGPGNRLSSFSVATNYTLYDNGKSLTEFRMSRITRRLADAQYARARETLLFNLTKAFQAHSLDRKSLDVREEQFRLIERQYRSLEQQRRQGLRMRRDVLRFRLQYERASIDLVSARTQVEQSAREILRVMGLPADAAEAAKLFKPLDLETGPSAVPKVEPGAERLPDPQIARLQADAQQGAVSIARRRQWPELSLSLGANYGADGYWGNVGDVPDAGRGHLAYSDFDHWGWKAALTLDYNIFDWGIRRREKNIAAAREAAARAEATAKLRESQATLENLAQDLERLQKLYDQGRDLRRLEQQNYDYVSAEYREGKVTYLDLIDSLNSLLSARLSYYSNVRDLLSKVTEYQYQEGKLHEVIEAL